MPFSSKEHLLKTLHPIILNTDEAYLTFGQRKCVSQMKAPIHIRIREGYKVLALAAKSSKKQSTEKKVLSSFYNEGLSGGNACYK